MYSLLLAIIYIAFISLGLPDSLLGAGWPAMYSVFGVPVPFMGIITMIISGCTIIASLLSDRLTRKLGANTVTIISIFLTAIALFGFSFANQFWMLVVLAIPYGLGAGAIDAALNNYVAIHYTSKHMSWLHCFWGLGAIISPFVMSYALASSVWNDGYRIVAFIQLGIGALMLFTLPLWKVNKTPSLEGQNSRSVGIVGALKIKGVPYLLIGFFAYCAAEATAMGWAGTYFSQVKGVSEQTAAAYASLFFIGLTVGRFVGGFIMDKIGDRKMIIIGTITAILGVLCMFIPMFITIDGELLEVVGFIVIGLGFAPIYPCIIHATPYNFGTENSGAIIGIQMASAYTGSTLMPPLYGFVGKILGYNVMPIYLLIFIVLMIIMTERTFNLTQVKTGKI